MNQQTKDQIAREAVSHAYVIEDNDLRNYSEQSYIAGAETWAERGEVLKEALEKVCKLCQQDEILDIGQLVYEIGGMAESAIENFKDK